MRDDSCCKWARLNRYSLFMKTIRQQFNCVNRGGWEAGLRRQGGEEPRGVTGIFFWGGNVIFPEFFPGVKCFLPVENSRFGRPKTNFRLFQKSFFFEKKKKKKGSSPLFITFLTYISNFPPSLLQFSFFPSQFSPLFPFFLASFFPIRQQKFPGQSLGALSPPPACYATGGA